MGLSVLCAQTLTVSVQVLMNMRHFTLWSPSQGKSCTHESASKPTLRFTRLSTFTLTFQRTLSPLFGNNVARHFPRRGQLSFGKLCTRTYYAQRSSQATDLSLDSWSSCLESSFLCGLFSRSHGLSLSPWIVGVTSQTRAVVRLRTNPAHPELQSRSFWGTQADSPHSPKSGEW